MEGVFLEMIYAVFLCDKQWKITSIQQCTSELELKEGDYLTNHVSEKLESEYKEDEQHSLELTFKEQKMKMSAIIQFYKEGNLVVLACIHNNQEFLEFGKIYPEYQEWAKNHLRGLYHNEYYLIQQINNQLVDAKRQLMRSNRKLEQALRENQEINQKLDEARILAERASISKTNFLSSMSHDIRTPMNAIVGLTELMQYNLNRPEILENYIKKLRSSSQYLLDLINDILDLSKIESGSLELKMEMMDIGAQIEQVITIIRPQIAKKELELSVDGESARYGYMLGDPVRFRQILMNIFSNAIKYTPEGGKIYFRIHENDIEDQRRNYQFIIEDSGIGMSAEFLEHIFDPFARAETSAREIQGTGLGMAITKNIVDALDGSIHVSSVLGEGSCFEINLPFEVCQEENMSEKLTVEPVYEVKKEKDCLEGKRFLCAEDNELNAEILAAMLEIEGAECKIYENGKLLSDAFEVVTPGEYDAILMDVQMPVMNGYETTKKIRTGKNPLGKSIPIIAMTAEAFSEDVQKCLDVGMNAHIAKPVDIEKLKETICELIDKEI